MRGFVIVLVFLLVATVVSLSTWMLLHTDRQMIKAEVPADYLETSDTSQFSTYPIDLKRNRNDDSVLVVFPASEKEQERNVSVLVYDSAQYGLLMLGDRTAKPLEAATRLSKILQEPLVNLSRLPDGSYFARLSSCNYGGFIHIRLVTSAD